MKILFIANAHDVDYQCDVLFHGLKMILGTNVHEATAYRHMYDDFPAHEKLRLYGKGFSLAATVPQHLKSFHPPEVIRKNLQQHYYDLVVFGSVRRCREYFDSISRLYPPQKIVFVDGEDDQFISLDLLSKGFYFKRELAGRDYPNLYPICFGIPKEKIVKSIPKKFRDEAYIVPGKLSTYIYDTEECYYEGYRNSVYGITTQKAGWDCMRHYEILANGCIPYFPDLEQCPAETLFLFPKEIVLKTNAIISATTGLANLEPYAPNLLEWTRSKLTTESIAMYVLDTVGHHALATPDAWESKSYGWPSLLFAKGARKIKLSEDLRHSRREKRELNAFERALSHCKKNSRPIFGFITAPKSTFLAIRPKAFWVSGYLFTNDGTWPEAVIAQLDDSRVFHGNLLEVGHSGAKAFSILVSARHSGLKTLQIHGLHANGAKCTIAKKRIWCINKKSRNPIGMPAIATPLSITVPKQLTLPKCDNPKVSIIIPFYDQPDVTLRCLAAIAQHTTGIDYEVIAIDDASPDPTIEKITAVANLRQVRNAENLGYLLNINKGASIARGEYLVLLNNDTEVQNGWLAPMLNIFQEHPDCGAVTCKLVYPDGRLQNAGSIVLRNGETPHYGAFDDPQKPAYNYFKEVDCCIGACFMVRAMQFKDLNGFDEYYRPAYYEETDLMFRLRAIGRKTYYTPESVVIHHESITYGDKTNTRRTMLLAANREKFIKRWSEQLISQPQTINGDIFHARDKSASKKCVLVLADSSSAFSPQDTTRELAALLNSKQKDGANIKLFDLAIPSNISRTFWRDTQAAGIETFSGRFATLPAILDWIATNRKFVDTCVVMGKEIKHKYAGILSHYLEGKLQIIE